MIGSAAALAVLAVAPNLIGGHTLQRNTWPALAYITTPSGICSGELVAPRLVLTAGHCAPRKGHPRAASVTLRLAGTTEEHPVVRVYRHPHYQPATGTDQALLMLDKQVGIRPMPVSKGPRPGVALRIAGVGIAGQPSNYIAGAPYAAGTTVQNDQVCVDHYGSRFDPARQFCVENPGVTICFGDSGGPAQAGGRLVGIAVAVTGAIKDDVCDPAFPQLFDRLDLLWLKRIEAQTKGT